jgi:AcrR family transcriptional regulator
MPKKAILSTADPADPADDPGPGETGSDDVAARVAERTLARRGAGFTDERSRLTGEVRRLLDAALEVIGRQGTTGRARVTDIVAAAGLSNDAFYRHFPSKDDLVAALLEDGTERLVSYLAHQMEKESTPEGQVRRWVGGVLAQAREDIATTTLAVLGNGSNIGTGVRHNAVTPVAALLHEPFAALGCRDPELIASLVAHAALGKVGEHTWLRQAPTRAEIARITDFCLAAARR